MIIIPFRIESGPQYFEPKYSVSTIIIAQNIIFKTLELLLLHINSSSNHLIISLLTKKQLLHNTYLNYQVGI